MASINSQLIVESTIWIHNKTAHDVHFYVPAATPFDPLLPAKGSTLRGGILTSFLVLLISTLIMWIASSDKNIPRYKNGAKKRKEKNPGNHHVMTTLHRDTEFTKVIRYVLHNMYPVEEGSTQKFDYTVCRFFWSHKSERGSQNRFIATSSHHCLMNLFIDVLADFFKELPKKFFLFQFCFC